MTWIWWPRCARGPRSGNVRSEADGAGCVTAAHVGLRPGGSKGEAECGGRGGSLFFHFPFEPEKKNHHFQLNVTININSIILKNGWVYFLSPGTPTTNNNPNVLHSKRTLVIGDREVKGSELDMDPIRTLLRL